MAHRWRRSSAELAAVAAGAAALGIAAERNLYGFGAPGRWLPDLLVGWTFVGSGLVARRCGRGSLTGGLLVATGATWFLPNFVGQALYLHRGPLVQLVLTFPDGRPRRRLELAAVAAGYAAAVSTHVWSSPSTTIACSVVLVVLAVLLRRRTIGAERRRRAYAVYATTFLAATLVATASLHPVLHAYEGALIFLGIAGVVVALRAPWERVPVTDLVVELGESRSATLRDALARALGDPTLQVGFRVGDDHRFVDGAGREVVLPSPEESRATTFVERDGSRVAVLVHDPALLGDPSLGVALAAAANLAAANARLQAELRARVGEVAASRRRILAARDAERMRLERLLREGAQRRLDEVASLLADAGATECAAELAEAQEELRRFARGIHPHDLSEQGLAPALRALADRHAFDVELAVASLDATPSVEICAYFVCSEALANVAKYAGASTVRISVEEAGDDVTVCVEDDGVGGAEPDRGTGLRGLADRVETLGGRFTVDSRPGAGTRLTAVLPRRA
jgi:signal transduction histidine kinase